MSADGVANSAQIAEIRARAEAARDEETDLGELPWFVEGQFSCHGFSSAVDDFCCVASPNAVLALVEVAEAAHALIEDTKNGGQQELRREPCGDDGCGYAACALARALSKFSTTGGH